MIDEKLNAESGNLKPRLQVMDAYFRSLDRYGELYRKLAEKVSSAGDGVGGDCGELGQARLERMNKDDAA